MRPATIAILVLLLSSLMTACGQRGPLYLPDEAIRELPGAGKG